MPSSAPDALNAAQQPRPPGRLPVGMLRPVRLKVAASPSFDVHDDKYEYPAIYCHLAVLGKTFGTESDTFSGLETDVFSVRPPGDDTRHSPELSHRISRHGVRRTIWRQSSSAFFLCALATTGHVSSPEFMVLLRKNGGFRERTSIRIPLTGIPAMGGS